MLYLVDMLEDAVELIKAVITDNHLTLALLVMLNLDRSPDTV